MSSLFEKMVLSRRGSFSMLRPRDGSMFESDDWDTLGFEEAQEENTDVLVRDNSVLFEGKVQPILMQKGIEMPNSEIEQSAVIRGERDRVSEYMQNSVVKREIKTGIVHHGDAEQKNNALLSEEDIDVGYAASEVHVRALHTHSENNYLMNKGEGKGKDLKQNEELSHQDIVQHLNEQHVKIENNAYVVDRSVESVQSNNVTNIVERQSILNHKGAMQTPDIALQKKAKTKRYAYNDSDDGGNVHIHIGSIHVRAQEQEQTKTHVASLPCNVPDVAVQRRVEGAPSLDDYLKQQEKI